jgi:hypothetical protein
MRVDENAGLMLSEAWMGPADGHVAVLLVAEEHVAALVLIRGADEEGARQSAEVVGAPRRLEHGAQHLFQAVGAERRRHQIGVVEDQLVARVVAVAAAHQAAQAARRGAQGPAPARRANPGRSTCPSWKRRRSIGARRPPGTCAMAAMNSSTE